MGENRKGEDKIKQDRNSKIGNYVIKMSDRNWGRQDGKTSKGWT